MKQLSFFLMAIVFLNSCIGTDLVEEIEVPEQVLISTNNSNLKVGDQLQYNALYTNKYGMTENKPIVWTTTTPDLVSVSSVGLVKALKTGVATIKATSGNVTSTRNLIISTDIKSDTLATLRSGTFKSAGSGSYTVAGDVTITTSGGKSKITFSENFKASIGPSLFLLLTNHTNGSYMVVSNNPAINGTSAQISLTRLTNFQGAMTWDVPAGVDVKNYKFATLYCTLGPVFGFAELK